MRLLGLGAALTAMFATAGSALAAPLPFDPDVATREWLATMDQAAVARSNSYFEGGYWIQFVGPLIGFVIAFVLLQTGFAKNLRSWLEKNLKVYFFVVIGFALVYSLIGSLVSFPGTIGSISYASTITICRRRRSRSGSWNTRRNLASA